MFASEARRYIESLIRQRKTIARTGGCQKPDALYVATQLEVLLRTYRYNTNADMAHFFVRKQAEIHFIIPAHKQHTNSQTVTRFTELLNEARQILSKQLLEIR